MITSNIILQNNWLMNKMVKPNEDLADQTSSNCRSPRFKLCSMSVFNLAVFFLFNLLHFTEWFYGLFSIKKYIQNYFGAIINNFSFVPLVHIHRKYGDLCPSLRS